jgi:hypothetical protein
MGRGVLSESAKKSSKYVSSDLRTSLANNINIQSSKITLQIIAKIDGINQNKKLLRLIEIKT